MSVDGFFDDWTELDPKSLPDPKEGPFLATNNATARNAYGRPTHVFLTSMFHADAGPKGPVTAFADGELRQVWGCILYRSVFPSVRPQ